MAITIIVNGIDITQEFLSALSSKTGNSTVNTKNTNANNQYGPRHFYELGWEAAKKGGTYSPSSWKDVTLRSAWNKGNIAGKDASNPYPSPSQSPQGGYKDGYNDALSSTISSTLYTDLPSYNQGYEDGYDQGFLEAYKIAYESGYKKGKIDGTNEGLVIGLSLSES